LRNNIGAKAACKMLMKLTTGGRTKEMEGKVWLKDEIMVNESGYGKCGKITCVKIMRDNVKHWKCKIWHIKDRHGKRDKLCVTHLIIKWCLIGKSKICGTTFL